MLNDHSLVFFVFAAMETIHGHADASANFEIAIFS